MGLLFRDDDEIHETPEHGRSFPRYRNLIEDHWLDWLKLSIITTIGGLPLALGIAISILSTSILLMIPLSFIGGAIFGVFYSAYYDNFLCRLRNDYMPWRERYVKAFKQNWKASLLPGGIFGLLIGSFTFMAFMLYWKESPVSLSSIIMMALSALIFLSFSSLYWSLLVLYEQPFRNRMINIIAFSSKYLWRVLVIGLMQLMILILTIFFAPWSLIFVPFLAWYFRFIVIYRIYDELDEFFSIEESIASINEQN